MEWADRIELWNDIIVDGSAKDSDRRLNEIIFLETQIKTLIQAIRPEPPRMGTPVLGLHGGPLPRKVKSNPLLWRLELVN